jgi:hypothetical protein
MESKAWIVKAKDRTVLSYFYSFFLGFSNRKGILRLKDGNLSFTDKKGEVVFNQPLNTAWKSWQGFGVTVNGINYVVTFSNPFFMGKDDYIFGGKLKKQWMEAIDELSEAPRSPE